MEKKCLLVLLTLLVLAISTHCFLPDFAVEQASHSEPEPECGQSAVEDTVIYDEKEIPFCIISYDDGDNAVIEMVTRKDSCFHLALEMIRSGRCFDSEWRKQRKK